MKQSGVIATSARALAAVRSSFAQARTAAKRNRGSNRSAHNSSSRRSDETEAGG